MIHTKVKSKTIVDNTGKVVELSVLLIEKDGEVKPLWSLHWYLLKNKDMSITWQKQVIQAVGLLLDYIEVNHNSFSDPNDVFRYFTDAVYAGTIGEDGNDPSGLYWLPRRTGTARKLLVALTMFSDWMHEEYGSVPLNPWRKATAYEERLNWAAQVNKSKRSFLGHLSNPDKMTETAKEARNTRQRKRDYSVNANTKAFSEERIYELLFEGFKISDKKDDLLEKYNWRDIAITILLHGGGLRKSEAFHLWTCDVMPDPSDPQLALVRVYHPIDGVAPKGVKGINNRDLPNREAYLWSEYLLLPRNKMRDTKRAGWKSPKMSDTEQNYMQVYWFSRDWGYLFMQAWKLYLHQLIRENIFVTKHPFLFVSFTEAERGEMYTIDAFRDSHSRAVRKIGLEVGKALGTTEHGHRHAYGQRLKKAKVEGRIIQAGMHHQCEESHKIYTVPTIAEITKILTEATQVLDSGKRLSMATDMNAFISQDYKSQR